MDLQQCIAAVRKKATLPQTEEQILSAARTVYLINKLGDVTSVGIFMDEIKHRTKYGTANQRG